MKATFFSAFIQNLKLRHTRHECNANNQYIENNGHDLVDATNFEKYLTTEFYLLRHP